MKKDDVHDWYDAVLNLSGTRGATNSFSFADLVHFLGLTKPELPELVRSKVAVWSRGSDNDLGKAEEPD